MNSRSGLAFLILIIVAAIVAYLSLTSFTHASNVATGKDPETQETNVDKAKNAVENFNKLQAQDLEKYDQIVN